MIPEKLLEVLKQDGVVAIATLGEEGPHLVNTWNSYIRITSDERLLITLGSSKVAGNMGPGTGFLVKGTAEIASAGADFDLIKAKFAWARAVLAVTIASATQTL